MSSTLAFGHPMLKYWSFDPNVVNLNHGAFGSVPRPVQKASEALTERIESYPDKFYRIDFIPLWRETRSLLSQLVGADPDECVLVPNVSTGINTVLRNFEWKEGDVIIKTNVAFGTVDRAVHHLGSLSPLPIISTVELELPASHTSIVEQFRAHLLSVKKTPGPLGRKIVAVFDSILSSPGMLMPWQKMAAACKEEGIWSVVDAAHSIGHELDIDLTKAAPDFWVTSCAKWLYTKRGVAMLYVPRRNQHLVRTGLPTGYPLVAQEAKDDSTPFVSEFIWNGAQEATSYLSIKPALEFRQSLGGERKINEYCQSLAEEGGKRMAEILGTSVMDTNPPDALNRTAMVNVELPLSPSIKPSANILRLLQHKLFVERKNYGAPYFHNGKWWARMCAQVYNEIDDFEKLARVFVEVCKEVEEVSGVRK